MEIKDALREAIENSDFPSLEKLLSSNYSSVTKEIVQNEMLVPLACRKGDVKTLKLLLQDNRFDANEFDRFSQSFPFDIVMESNDESLQLDMLLEIIRHKEFDPLKSKCGNLKKAMLLLDKQGLLSELIKGDSGSMLLIAFAVFGCTESVRLLVKQPGIDVNFTWYRGWTALTQACNQGYAEIVELLLTHPNINVNLTQNQELHTPLVYACGVGSPKIAELLLKHPGIDVNLSGRDNWTPLMTACLVQNLEVVKLFLADPRVDITLRGHQDLDALMLTCLLGNEDVLSALLDHPNITECMTDNLYLHLALNSDHITALKVLIEHPKMDPTKVIDCFELVLLSLAEKKKYRVIMFLMQHPRVYRRICRYCDETGRYCSIEYRGISGRLTKWVIALRSDVNRLVSKGAPWLPVFLKWFQKNPMATRANFRKDLQLLGVTAAEYFGFIVLLCDGYVQIKRIVTRTWQKPVRFLTIAQRLPMELQMILCNTIVGSSQSIIPKPYIDLALSSIFNILVLQK